MGFHEDSLAEIGGEEALRRYFHGVELFNNRQFFEAHEVLEDVWRPCMGRSRLFLQGLIQVAVGLHHHSTGNLVGAKSLARRGLKKLAQYPGQYAMVDATALRFEVKRWVEALDHDAPLPPPPRIKLLAGRC